MTRGSGLVRSRIQLSRDLSRFRPRSDLPRASESRRCRPGRRAGLLLLRPQQGVGTVDQMQERRTRYFITVRTRHTTHPPVVASDAR